MRTFAALLGGLMFFSLICFPSVASADGMPVPQQQECSGCTAYENAHAKPKPTKIRLVCYKFEQQAKDAVVLTILDVRGMTLPQDPTKLDALLSQLIAGKDHIVHRAASKVAKPLDEYCIGEWRVVQILKEGYLVILCNGLPGGNKKAVFRPADSQAILNGEYRRACLANHCEHATHSL